MESIDVSSMFFEKTSMFAHIESSFVWMANWASELATRRPDCDNYFVYLLIFECIKAISIVFVYSRKYFILSVSQFLNTSVVTIIKMIFPINIYLQI